MEMRLHERSHPKEMNAVGEIVVSPSLPCPLAGSQRSLYPPRADEAAASRDTDEVTASRAAAVPDRRHHRTMRASSPRILTAEDLVPTRRWPAVAAFEVRRPLNPAELPVNRAHGAPREMPWAASTAAV